MKLSILIFVLATIVCGCQCAPNPGWREDLDQNMQNLNKRLNEDREKRNQGLDQLHERLEAQRREREENLRQLHERLEAQRQQREENMKQLHERLEAERQQREEKMKPLLERWEKEGQKDNGIRTYINVYTANGVKMYNRIEDRIVNNVRERTVTQYSFGTNKAEIKKYKCEISTNSPCVLESTEVKDGPPPNVNL